MFLAAAAIGVLAFALCWFIAELQLRETVTTSGIGESFAIPERPLAREIARALSLLAGRDAKRQAIERIAEHAGVDLTPAQCWTLIRIDEDPSATPAALARRAQVEPSISRTRPRCSRSAG